MKGLDSFVFGKWIRDFELTPAALHQIVSDARMRVREASTVSENELAKTIDSLRSLWDENGSSRKAFLESRPDKSLGLSPAMIERGLDHFVRALYPRVAEARIARQLGSRKGAGSSGSAEPLGVVLHVVSGNVFFGPCESLLAGLLTRNVNLVKRPRAGSDFLTSFFRSLDEAAPKLAAQSALLAWPGGSVDVERYLGREVDGIVVAGDTETIAAYRALASPLTTLVEFGPRVSVAIVSRATLDAVDMGGLARDVSLWDQLACTAAQCVYVQGNAGGVDLAGRLAGSLNELARTLPEGPAALDERIEIGRFRDRARFAEAMGTAKVFCGAKDELVTVVFEADSTFTPSPLRRAVTVKPYEEISDLTEALSPVRGILQTVGLSVSPSERGSYQRGLSSLGVRRFCPIGEMNEPGPDSLHDGTMELQRLTRWAESCGFEESR
jgi:hypothetical protein